MQRTKARELLKNFRQKNAKAHIQESLLEIDLQSIREISKKSGLSLRNTEIEALESGIVPSRYKRNLNTLTLADQISLLKAEIVVLGVGGLGGYVLEMLCRMGVGQIIVVDGDIFEQTNLNRQVMATEKNLGQNKARAAKDRMAYVNSCVEVEAIAKFLGKKELEVILKDKDLVVDALGGLAVRKTLHAAAQIAGLPVVCGFVAGRTGCVSTVLPGDRGLVSMWEGSYGAEEPLGCLAYTVAAIASMQCAEVINLICAKHEPELQHKMAVCDLQECTWEVFEISR